MVKHHKSKYNPENTNNLMYNDYTSMEDMKELDTNIPCYREYVRMKTTEADLENLKKKTIDDYASYFAKSIIAINIMDNSSGGQFKSNNKFIPMAELVKIMGGDEIFNDLLPPLPYTPKQNETIAMTDLKRSLYYYEIDHAPYFRSKKLNDTHIYYHELDKAIEEKLKVKGVIRIVGFKIHEFFLERTYLISFLLFIFFGVMLSYFK